MSKAPSEILKRTKSEAKKGDKKAGHSNALMAFISKAKQSNLKGK